MPHQRIFAEVLYTDEEDASWNFSPGVKGEGKIFAEPLLIWVACGVRDLSCATRVFYMAARGGK